MKRDIYLHIPHVGFDVAKLDIQEDLESRTKEILVLLIILYIALQNLNVHKRKSPDWIQ